VPHGAGTIVVVEDDANIADLLDMYLRREGFRVIQTDNGRDGLARVDREKPQLVILDVGLPGDLDGLAVCRQLRTSSDVPVLMLTARDGEVDRIVGLEIGADDYVTKPFSPRELVARIRVVLRRLAPPAAPPAAARFELRASEARILFRGQPDDQEIAEQDAQPDLHATTRL
jgi:two-component system catabolic regulation response regulator CreB